MTVVNSIETVGPWRKRLEIEVPMQEVDVETANVVREYGKQVHIPGFRKGKVPPMIVQQRFRDEIEREVLDRLIPRYWQQAQEESDLDPMRPPSVGSVELREGEPLVFEATVEVRPEFEIGDVDDFDLPEESTEPTDDEVGKALERLQMQVAEWVDAERAVSRGDLVTIELDEEGEDGESIEGPKELQVEVGEEGVWEELSLALTGLLPQQETDFRRQEEREGETRVRSFHAKVLSVQERDLPPLDDQLAKRLGDFENLEDLQDKVRHQLLHEKKHELRARREQAVLDQLRDRHPLELPEGVVDEEAQDLLRDYAQSLSRQGIDVENTQIDWDGLAKEIRPQAERRVHVRLLLDAVSKKEGIEVEQSEVEERVAMVARAQGKNLAKTRLALSRDGRIEALRSQLLHEKTMLRLLGPEDECDHKSHHDDGSTDEAAAESDSQGDQQC